MKHGLESNPNTKLNTLDTASEACLQETLALELQVKQLALQVEVTSSLLLPTQLTLFEVTEYNRPIKINGLGGS